MYILLRYRSSLDASPLLITAMLYTDEKEYAPPSIHSNPSSSHIPSFTKMIFKDSTIRYAGYIVIFTLSIAEFVLGVMAAANYTVKSKPLYVALAFSIVTIVAVIALSVFNRNRSSTFFLSKLYAHIAILVLIAEAWFHLTILLTSDASLSCPNAYNYRPNRGYWYRPDGQSCSLPIAGAVFAYVLCTVATTLAVFVAIRGQKLGYRVNITETDAALGPIYLSDEVERQPLVAGTPEMQTASK